MKRILAFALMLCAAVGVVSTAAAQDATATAEATSAAVSSDTSATAEATSMTFAADARTPDEICQTASTAEPATRKFSQPDQVLQQGVDYRAVFCTDSGSVYVDLLEAYSPIAVNSFIFLSQKGYYNNTTFHRVIQDFMAQGGDPTATGTGDPGYSFDLENTGFLHFDKPGWLAMANTGQPNSNGSQFFITTVPYPSLDFGYTIFGEVLEGQQNVAAIKLRDPDTATDPGTTLKTVVIVDDPTTVKTSYTAPAQPTEADVTAAFNKIDTMLSTESGFKNVVTTQTTDEATAAAPEASQDLLKKLLTDHHHEFRVSGTSTVCKLDQIPLMSASYTLDSFPTAEDAAAALADPALDQIETTAGLAKSTPTTLPNALYTENTTACDTPAIHAVTHWTRGRYLITADVILPADSTVTPDLRLRDFAGVVYEYTISDILRTQIR